MSFPRGAELAQIASAALPGRRQFRACRQINLGSIQRVVNDRFIASDRDQSGDQSIVLISTIRSVPLLSHGRTSRSSSTRVNLSTPAGLLDSSCFPLVREISKFKEDVLLSYLIMKGSWIHLFCVRCRLYYKKLNINDLLRCFRKFFFLT